MKKSFIHIALAFALVLTLIGFGLFAPQITAAGTPDLTIKGANLTLGDTVYISFVVPKTDGIQLLVRKGSPDAMEVTTLLPAGEMNVSGVPHSLFSFPIAAKEMSMNIYAQAKAGEDVGPMLKYGVLQYVLNKKNAASPNYSLITVLNAMLDYGAAAQVYFNVNTGRPANGDFYEVKIEGGTLSDGMAKGIYLVGESVTMTAPATNEDGDPFSYWTKDEIIVGDTNVLTVSMGTANATYTAVYGAAAPTTSVGLELALNEDGNSYSVTGIGACTDENVIIPSAYDGKPVTAIGNNAFSGDYNITSVTIPESVTTIGVNAFNGCGRLTGVVIPEGVTTIGDCAFSYCAKLASITIPSTVTTIGNQAFCEYLGELTSITVAAGNTTYHSDGNCLIETATKTLLAGCKNSVIPTDGSVTTIGDYVFYGSDLASVTIPSCVTSVGEGAFRYSDITNLNIPIGLTSIGDSAFTNCYYLESITVAAGNTKYHSAGNCLIETATKTLIAGCKNSVIPTDGSVTTIGGYTFMYDEVTDVTIPSGVTTIGQSAYRSSHVETLTIADSVTSIGASAFRQCGSLVSVTMGSGVKTIGDSAFDNCYGLTSITLGSSVESIASHAFANCSYLESVTLPSTLTSIDSWVFSYAYNLTDIHYDGTMAQWNAIPKGFGWDYDTGSYTIHCTDGNIAK